MKSIVVIGTGQMGRGIAQALLCAGIDVSLIGRTLIRAEEGMRAIQGSFEKLVAKGKMSEDQAGAAVARLSWSQWSPTRLEAADLVIESVPEDLALKEGLFRELGRITRAETILATNTSSLSVTALGAASGVPERVIGMHFFNPAPVMALVEVVSGIQTGDAARAAATALVGKLGKTSVMVRDGGGFVVNRLLFAMLNEAARLAGEGAATIDDIDQAMRLGLSHPMGPFALMDFIGLDTCIAILESLERDHGDPRFHPAPFLRQHVAAGRLGKKSGAGFRSY